jgi:hypothetical protein
VKRDRLNVSDGGKALVRFYEKAQLKDCSARTASAFINLIWRLLWTNKERLKAVVSED